MTTRPWWAVALQWTLWALMMSGMMAWLARSRLRSKGDSATVLSHPPGILAIGVTCTTVFLAFAALSVNAATGGPRVAAAFLAFALLGVYLILEYYFVRFEVLPRGLAFRTLFGGSGLIEWSLINRISWSTIPKWFLISIAGGKKIRVSAMLRGLPAFSSAVLANVPAERVDDDARKLIQAAAHGDLPQVW